MPIKPENMKLYPGGSIHSPEWKAIRARIQERAGDKCETCQVPNGRMIIRSSDGERYFLEESQGAGVGTVHSAEDGMQVGCGVAWYDFDSGGNGLFKVVCTTAHLNHNVVDNRDDNLAFLCQRCHNRHDAPHRRANAEKTRRGKLATGDLFNE